MTERPKVAILASGSGTTAEAFIYGTQNGSVNAEVSLVVTNNPSAGVLGVVERANANGENIEARVINGKSFPGDAEPGSQTEAEAAAILEAVHDAQATLVLLLGYMKKVREPLLGGIPMLNTHPGLLPFSAGMHGVGVQEAAIAAHEKNAGQTLHLVEAEYDSGEAVVEHTIPIIYEGKFIDTPASLFNSVQLLEKANIARDVQLYLNKQAQIEAQRVRNRIPGQE